MAGPLSIAGQIARLARRVAEIERRLRGRSRTGTVAASDPVRGLYRVQMTEGFLTPWIPVQALSSGGISIQAEPIIGQSVTVESESGDLTDATISMSSFSDSAPRPSSKAGEFVVAKGGVRLVLTDDGVTITGPVTINGNIATNGTLTNNGKDVGSTHTHSGVDTGPGSTGTPN